MQALGRAALLARPRPPLSHVSVTPCLGSRHRQHHGSGGPKPAPRAWWPLLLAWQAASSSSRHKPSAAAAPEQQAGADSSLTGTWIRDNEASEMDSYDRMLGLMQLSGLQRTTALRLIEGVELEQTEQGLSVRFLTVVPFFSVTERVVFGSETAQPRRDLRPGQQLARAARVRGGVYVEMRWGEPVAGSLAETYRREGDTLLVHSAVDIGGATQDTTVVYRRSDAWRPRFSFPGGG